MDDLFKLLNPNKKLTYVCQCAYSSVTKGVMTITGMKNIKVVKVEGLN